MFSGNDLPIGPTGSFPRQRIDTSGNVIAPPSDAEGAYMNNPFVQLPTEEKEYSSVVDRAKMHMNFGEAKNLKPRSLRKMGGGFQRDRQRAALKNSRPMPGHGDPGMLPEPQIDVESKGGSLEGIWNFGIRMLGGKGLRSARRVSRQLSGGDRSF